MSTTTKLCKDAFGKNVERKIYRSMIGSLLYLTVSRLDISFSIGAYARYLMITTKKCYFLDLIIMILSTFE